MSGGDVFGLLPTWPQTVCTSSVVLQALIVSFIRVAPCVTK